MVNTSVWRQHQFPWYLRLLASNCQLASRPVSFNLQAEINVHWCFRVIKKNHLSNSMLARRGLNANVSCRLRVANKFQICCKPSWEFGELAWECVKMKSPDTFSLRQTETAPTFLTKWLVMWTINTRYLNLLLFMSLPVFQSPALWPTSCLSASLYIKGLSEISHNRLKLIWCFLFLNTCTQEK